MSEDYLDETPFIGDAYPSDKEGLPQSTDIKCDVNSVVEPALDDSGMSMRIDEINTNVNALAEKLNILIKNQESQIEKVTGELSFKACIPLYRLMIEYVDRLGEMLRRQDHLIDMNESLDIRYETLFESVEELQQYIIGQLDIHQIEAFKDVADNPLMKTERQEVVECQVENNENEFLRYGEDVDMFYISSSPGYIYRSVDFDQSEVIIRPEKVIKVVKSNDSF